LGLTFRSAVLASSSCSFDAVSIGFALPKGFDLGPDDVTGRLSGVRSPVVVRSSGAANYRSRGQGSAAEDLNIRRSDRLDQVRHERSATTCAGDAAFVMLLGWSKGLCSGAQQH